jgi:hypothetical protein
MKLKNFFFRTWRKARLVYTDKLLIFASTVGAEVIDVLPMKEIMSVRSEADSLRRASTFDIDREDAGSDPDAEEAAPTSGRTNEHASGSAAFVIQTLMDGYNSGRAYRVRAMSAKDCSLLMDEISRISSGARERSLARSRFGRIQERVRAVFTSSPAQKFIALLIFAVRSLPSSSLALLRFWMAASESHRAHSTSSFFTCGSALLRHPASSP